MKARHLSRLSPAGFAAFPARRLVKPLCFACGRPLRQVPTGTEHVAWRRCSYEGLVHGVSVFHYEPDAPALFDTFAIGYYHEEEPCTSAT